MKQKKSTWVKRARNKDYWFTGGRKYLVENTIEGKRASGTTKMVKFYSVKKKGD